VRILCLLSGHYRAQWTCAEANPNGEQATRKLLRWYASNSPSRYAISLSSHALEIVVGQESQICPAFILKIADNDKLHSTLDTWNREVDAIEEKMQIRNRIVELSGVHAPLLFRGVHCHGVLLETPELFVVRFCLLFVCLLFVCLFD
jgi:hypothetical protein